MSTARAHAHALDAAAPVRIEQARDEHGHLLWIHGCGETCWTAAAPPSLLRCPECGKPGQWRPLLVAADAPQQAGPVVLTLPEVPEGAVSVVGVASPHRRYEPFGDLPFDDDPAWRRADDGALFSGIGAVLDAEAPRGVTVEMAPREPRTWPKLDTIPEDIKTVRGASGRIWHQSHRDHNNNLIFCEHDGNGRPIGTGVPFHALQACDGPLTEDDA